ncbi:hypothetical protein Tco_0646860, partial [Tanacetum coccineum]
YGHFCHLDFFGLFRGERGISTARVILFGTIPIAIPAIVPIVDPHVVYDDTPLIPIQTPTILPVVSTLPHTSSFLYTDSSNSDTFERPPSQDPYEILPAPPSLPCRPTIFVLHGQPIPVSRPYHTQPNRVRKMLTARKSVRPLPSHRLALRYSDSHSPSDHFSPDDSSSDFSSDLSSDYSDTSSGRSLSNSSFDTPAAIFARPSRKRRRSPAV